MKNALPWDREQVTRSVPQQICKSNGGISQRRTAEEKSCFADPADCISQYVLYLRHMGATPKYIMFYIKIWVEFCIPFQCFNNFHIQRSASWKPSLVASAPYVPNFLTVSVALNGAWFPWNKHVQRCVFITMRQNATQIKECKIDRKWGLGLTCFFHIVVGGTESTDVTKGLLCSVICQDEVKVRNSCLISLPSCYFLATRVKPLPGYLCSTTSSENVHP